MTALDAGAGYATAGFLPVPVDSDIVATVNAAPCPLLSLLAPTLPMEGAR
jgi:hypothetical protein